METTYDTKVRRLTDLEAETGQQMTYCQRCTVGPFVHVPERSQPGLCLDCADHS